MIVVFVYRICRRGTDLDATDEIALTSVVPDMEFTETTVDKSATILQCSMASEMSRRATTETIGVEKV